MTHGERQVETLDGPDGSIFLFQPLGQKAFDALCFALIQGRGEYHGLEPDEQDDVLRELRLRRNVTVSLEAAEEEGSIT